MFVSRLMVLAVVVLAGRAFAEIDPQSDPRLARWDHFCSDSKGLLVIETQTHWKERRAHVRSVRVNDVEMDAKSLAKLNASIPAGAALIESTVVCSPLTYSVKLGYRPIGVPYTRGWILWTMRHDGKLVEDDFVVGPPRNPADS